MREVQATEAKTHLAQLLSAIERFRTWRASWRGIDMSIEELLAARHEEYRH